MAEVEYSAIFFMRSIAFSVPNDCLGITTDALLYSGETFLALRPLCVEELLEGELD